MQPPMSNLLISRDLLLEEGKQDRSREKSYENNESVSIKFGNVSSANSLTLSEGIKSNSRKSDSYSRMATRRFASSHTVGIWDLKSSDLSGVKSSAVISAWGLSRPRVDFLATNRDIHREFNVDLLNLMPANREFAEWVSNGDALIKDGHLRSYKGEVKEIADQQRPTQGCDEAINSLDQETLRGDTGTEKIDANGEEVTTSCSVDLRISHVNSLSRKVVR
jgi:hypothetical protein